MQPQLPSERKKRIVFALIAAVIALAMFGNFFWPILKDLHHAGQNGNHGSNVPLLIFGGFFLLIILAIVFSAVRGIRKQSNSAAAIQPPRDPKPWLARTDWAAGKIKSSATAPVKFFLLWSFLALAMSAPAVHAIPKEWQKGNHAILFVLIFPVVAFYLLGYAFVKWRSQRRFGDCFFEPAQIPAPLGGMLEGMIQTGAQLKLEHGLHLKFSCIRRTVSGSGKSQPASMKIFSGRTKRFFKAEASLPEW